MGKKAFLFILFFLGLFFSFQTANAAGVYYYENIDIDIKINKDSAFDVTENQIYFLDGNFGFFYRDIELKDLDHISNIEVFDSENNRVLNPDISYKGNRLHIQWNFQRRDFEKELKSWMIKYKVHGGLGFFKDHDEIYWNAVFEDRDVSVKKASATVHLPEGIADFGTKMFVGQKGNTKQSYDYNSKTGSVSFFGYNLKPGEFLTVAVWWPKGFVEKPFLYKNQIYVLVAIILSSLIPFLVAISFYIIWL
ncbi:MAG: DUF2207 domain-containing protein, partial [Nanoarchaeota archaeon]|nr:DUF2207 domain-containing protein [Nanoarchaeota archaeon]